MLETKDLILKKGDFEDWHDMYVNLWSHDESARYMLWKPVHSEEFDNLGAAKFVGLCRTHNIAAKQLFYHAVLHTPIQRIEQN